MTQQDPPDYAPTPPSEVSDEEMESIYECADFCAEQVFDRMCQMIDESMEEHKIAIDRERYHDLVMAELHGILRMALRDNGSIHMVGELARDC